MYFFLFQFQIIDCAQSNCTINLYTQMMNNHFHLQPHEHNTPQNVAQQFAGAVAAAPTTYGYLTQPAAATANAQPQQWLTYQILPPPQPTLAANAGGGLPPAIGTAKRYYANTATAAGTAATAAAVAHPSSIQITNNYTQQQQQQQLQQQTQPNNINNIRIISTAPNVYSLNKTATEQLNQLYATPTSSAPELYAPVSAYYTATPNLQPKLQPPPLVPVSNNNNNNSGNHNVVASNTSAPSTVVLDRINICINNHYTEPNLCQPSPIIPAIQHKPLMPLIDSSAADSSCSSSSSSILSNGRSSSTTTTTNAAVIVIDEPDSTTTTPHTPPTTPETLSSPVKSPESSGCVLKQSFTSVSQSIEEAAVVAAGAPPTPPTPPPAQPPESNPCSPIVTSAPASISYALQEDVFIKCNDGRFYLGTIIAQSEQQYLVRFDENSEQWCEADRLKKLGNSEPSSGSGGATSTMCVACKRAQHEDIVEICERCGRGYHRGCTTEIASGVWCCKRCAKPMKMQASLVQNGGESKPPGICRKLPYHVS